ncbi:MAG: hypothetical protein AABZ55_01025 [Bdellovibrionota bacterium]
MTQAGFLIKKTRGSFVGTLVLASILILVGFLNPIYSLADELEAGEAKLSNSYNEYYQAIRSGKAQNKQDVMRLQQEIIAPAAGEVTQAIAKQEESAILKHIGRTITPQEAKAIEGKNQSIEDMTADEARKDAHKLIDDQNKEYAHSFGGVAPASDSDFQDTSGGKSAKVKVGSDSNQRRDDLVLDGKEVEKEIAFPGAGRAPATKTPKK